ncbi:MAG: RsmB/NOP family class I SAM-dependent RNA methyltransferase [Deltaproteobacteria bacterium]|nr:MAG: RsmB/NOP family class I SAM-dependent RNA methyltransferase [Deltaproteobacteria bacterium]
MNEFPDMDLAQAVAGGGSLADRVLRPWERTRIDWSFASDAIARELRARPALAHRERQFVAETVYGLIRNLRRVDAALAAGGLRAASRAPDRERLLAYLVLEAGLPVGVAARAAPAVDWRAVADVDARIARERDPARRLALRWSLPDWLAARLRSDWGDRAEALAAALNRRAPMTVRANTLVADRDALAAELGRDGIASEPGRWSPTALHVTTRTNLFALAAFRRGAFEAQDEGSQLIADLVAPPPRGRVVDVCAGAGGKALALAAALGGRGRVVAADVDRRKLAELRRRARRAGATNIQTVALEPDGEYPAPLARLAGRAARVLVDAPCSGIGALRRNPEARWRLSEADLDRLPRLQLAIARRARELVAPGGRLIYATCTLLRAENEAVVAALLAESPEFEPMPAKAVWGRDRAAGITGAGGRYLAVNPADHGTDGFFAAVVRRAR